MSFLGKFADSIKKFNADGKVYQIISGTFSLALLCATLIAFELGACSGKLKLTLFSLVLFALLIEGIVSIYVSHQSRFATIARELISFLLCETAIWIAIITLVNHSKDKFRLDFLPYYLTYIVILWPVTYTLIHLMFIYYSIQRTEKKIIACSAIIKMGYSIIGIIVSYSTLFYVLLDKFIFGPKLSSDEIVNYLAGEFIVIIFSMLNLCILNVEEGNALKNWINCKGTGKFSKFWNDFWGFIVFILWIVPFLIPCAIFAVELVVDLYRLSLIDDQEKTQKCIIVSNRPDASAVVSLLCIYFVFIFTLMRNSVFDKKMKSMKSSIQPSNSQELHI